MFQQALDKYDVDLMKSIMIGDKESDLVAAEKAEIRNLYLVRTGHKLMNSTYVAFDTLLDVIINKS